jgi:CheY-like chemotaxis protein
MNLTLGSKLTVLVVEDEPMLLLFAQDFLEDAGFQTLTAPNADAAIEVLETDDSINIVFTDINMPGSMDGLKLAHAIRNRWPPIVIVVTSGNVAPLELPTGSRFFNKPFEPQKVVDAMMAMVA